MQQVRHSWSALRRAGLQRSKVGRRAFRLFRTWPALGYDTVVDLGAHQGEFTDAARIVLAPRRCVLIEADPELARDLERRYGAQPGCEVVHAAVTDRAGPVELRINAHRDSSSILPITPAAERQFERDMREVARVEVPGRTLDEVFEALGLAAVALLKVDIQGAERRMIAGGGEALRRVRALYIEVSFEEFYEGSADFHELDGLLRELGFKLRSLHEERLGADGALAYANALYVRVPV